MIAIRGLIALNPWILRFRGILGTIATGIKSSKMTDFIEILLNSTQNECYL